MTITLWTKPIETWPALVNEKGYRGDPWHRGYKWFDVDELTGETVLTDTTGWTARMQVRAGRDDPAPAAEAICTVMVDHGGGDVDCVYAQIPEHVMATFPSGFNGWYDLEIVDASGQKQTVYYGRFEVEPDVTR